MKKLLLLPFMMLCINAASLAQTDVTVGQTIDPDKLKNKDDAFTLVQSIYQNDAQLKKSFSNWDGVLKAGAKIDELANDHAIVIIYHSFDNSKVENEKQVKQYVLHREKQGWKSEEDWSDYLLNTKNVLVVIIDGKDNIINSSVKIIKAKSRLSQEIADAGKVISQVAAFAIIANPSVKVRFISMNKKQIKVPCSIEISNESMKDKITVNIHELSRFSVHFGISANQLDRKNVSIANQSLVVTLDSAQKKEWKSNLIFELIWNPIRQDVDRFDPIWKIGSSDQPIRRIFSGFGIFGGLKAAKDPIQSLYGGINYAITKDFYISIGYAWNNDITPSVTSIGAITSVNDALNYAHRSYQRTTFFGLSFPPSTIIDMLGIKKK